MNFGLNLWNKVFGRMFGFIVILFMTPSGHPWIINEIQSNLFFCKFLDCFSLLLRLPLHSASPKWRRLTKRRAYLNLNRILLSFSSPILNEPCLPVTEQTALEPKNYSRFCQFEVKKEIRFYIDINLSSHF